MFCHATRDLRRLPPTRDALLHHCSLQKNDLPTRGGFLHKRTLHKSFCPHQKNMGGRKKLLEHGVHCYMWISFDIIPTVTRSECICKKVCTSCKCLQIFDAVYGPVQSFVFKSTCIGLFLLKHS